MSIYDVYAELRTAVGDELNRTDITDSQLDSFIRIAERRTWRKLRIPPMEVRASLSVVQPDRALDPDGLSEANIPADYLEPILFTSEVGYKIEWISSQQMRTLPTYQAVSDNLAGPSYVTRERNQFKFWPSYTGPVILSYYAEPEPAKYFSEQPENGGENPEIYDIIGEGIFYRAVAEGWRFVREPAKFEQYKKLWAAVMQDTSEQYANTDVTASTMITKNPYL